MTRLPLQRAGTAPVSALMRLLWSAARNYQQILRDYFTSLGRQMIRPDLATPGVIMPTVRAPSFGVIDAPKGAARVMIDRIAATPTSPWPHQIRRISFDGQTPWR